MVCFRILYQLTFSRIWYKLTCYRIRVPNDILVSYTKVLTCCRIKYQIRVITKLPNSDMFQNKVLIDILQNRISIKMLQNMAAVGMFWNMESMDMPYHRVLINLLYNYIIHKDKWICFKIFLHISLMQTGVSRRTANLHIASRTHGMCNQRK